MTAETPTDAQPTRRKDASDGQVSVGDNHAGGVQASREANPQTSTVNWSASGRTNEALRLAQLAPDGRSIALSSAYDTPGGRRNDAGDARPSEAGATNSDFGTEKAKLEKNMVGQGLTDTQQKQIHDSISMLERGTMIDAKSGQEVERKPPLSPEEKTKLLQQANRMFDQSDRIYAQGLTKEDRNAAVDAMFYDSTSPERMNQGRLNTCNVTGIGKVEAFMRPAEQAKRFVDMYTNANGDQTVTMPKFDRSGHVVMGEDGRPQEAKVKYDVNSLHLDGEARAALEQGQEGKKGLHDQFVKGLDHLLVNTYSQQVKGQFYKFDAPDRNGDAEQMRWGSFDGQSVMTPQGRLTNPGMNKFDEDNLAKGFNGGETSVLTSSYFGGRDAGYNVTSVSALNAAWERHGGKPMLATVEAGSDLLKSFTGGESGGHVVVIADRRMGANGQYEYKLDNSWGNNSDGWVSASSLTNAINPTAERNPQAYAGADAPSRPDGQPGLPSHLHYGDRANGDRREGVVRDPHAAGSRILDGPAGVDPHRGEHDKDEKDGVEKKKKAENDPEKTRRAQEQTINQINALMARALAAGASGDGAQARQLLAQIRALEASSPVPVSGLPNVAIYDGGNVIAA